MSDPAIAVDSVSKKYRLYDERNQSLKSALMRRGRARFTDFWALKDVSFEVPEGKTFALIGENGSGKSTLLKCIARILVPEKGTISRRGKISALLELGAGFHPELSGRDNVFLNGSVLGLSRKEIQRRFDDIVGFAGLEQFIDSPVKDYSSGMYVRLGFSVAIHVDPDILLIDEVLAVGDAEFQVKCIEKVDEMKQRGKTIVIVTHALGSVRNLCDQAVLLEHGVLRRVGDTSEVIDEYLGDVFTDRVKDGEQGQGQRWGTGDVRIERMEILDAAAEPAKRIRTGDAVTFRFHYEASDQVSGPVFGMAIHRIDGAEVTGPNTREAERLVKRVQGSGHIDLRVEHLLLVPGTYDLSASVYNHTLTHAYDHRQRAFRFDVEPGRPFAEFGVMALDGVWESELFQQ